MATAVTRRQFLRGGRRAPQRPPWAVSEAEFTTACDRCGDCIAACGARIIVAGSGGFPEIDFSHEACSFCGDCVRACRPGALAQRAGASPWQWRARIGESCIAMNGVVCGACGDACAEGAIRFSPAPRGVARPRLQTERCSGCGACYGVCPSRSIEMQLAEPQAAQV